METLIDLLEAATSRFGRRTALQIDGGQGSDEWSYDRLLLAARAIGAELHDRHGIEPGDRLMIWGPNSPRLVAAYFGALEAGAVLVPLDATSTKEFVGRVAAKTGARFLIAATCQPGVSDIQTIDLDSLPLTGGRTIDRRPRPTDLALVMFTSGTTGEPKGVMLTHANIVANVEALRYAMPRRSEYRLLSLLPLSHMFEQTVGLYVPLVHGATIVYLATLQPSAIAEALREHQITAMMVVPQVLELLLKGIEREVERTGRQKQWNLAHRLAAYLPRPLRRRLFSAVIDQLGGKLDFFTVGGARLESDLGLTWQRIGIDVLPGYGATECSPVITAGEPRDCRPCSVGRLIPDVEIRFSPEEEILVKGPSVSSGYWQNAKATEAVFTDDGWYRTGDLGELDSSGRLHLKGRLKDVIVLASGLNVYPEDVEAELRVESAVADCAVLGRPGHSGRISIFAVIAPAEGAERPEVAEAVRSANGRLADHQRIRDFTIWPLNDLPRTRLLKVKRHEVAARLDSKSLQAAAPKREEALARLDVVRSVLAKVTGADVSSMQPETSLALDLGLDSLAIVELVIGLEERGLFIDETVLANVETIAELADRVDEKDGGNGDRAAAGRLPGSRSGWLRRPLQAMLLFPIFRLACPVFRVVGREHLAELTGPVLFVANHSSHLDTPAVLRALPPERRRSTAVAAAEDYFFRNGILGAAVALLINAFPFSRDGSVRASLEACNLLAAGGHSILVYPEGTRSESETLQPFKSGIGLLARDLQLPIVPIHIEGTASVLPKGKLLPRSGAVTVTIGAPVRATQDAGPAETAAKLEQAVRQLGRVPVERISAVRPAARPHAGKGKVRPKLRSAGDS